MKIATFALIAALCVVAVTANASVSVEPVEEFDFELMSLELAEDVADIESYGIFSGMYWVLKAALRTLKGMNCAIQGAVNMKNAALQFPVDIHSCGVDATKQVQAVLNSCHAIVVTVDAIINVNTKVCNNPDWETEVEQNQKTGWNCFWKMLGKFNTLKKQIKKTLALIKKVPTIGTGANVCVNNALDDLTTTFTGFPAFVKACSKLTS